MCAEIIQSLNPCHRLYDNMSSYLVRLCVKNVIWRTSSSEVHAKWFSFEEIAVLHSVFRPAKMIPHRKWMAKCENEFVGLHLLHGEMSPLCSSAFEFPSCYLSQEQTNGQYVGAEKKKKGFCLKSAQHQMRMKWYRNSPSLALAVWSELQQHAGSLPLPGRRLIWYCSASLIRGRRC